MNIQFFVSTVNDKNILEFRQKNSHLQEVYFINQLKEGFESKFLHDANVFCIDSIGLSKSRNEALKRASADIILLTDNDVEYLKNAEDIISRAFEMFPNAAALCFKIKTNEGKDYKNYWKNIRKFSLMSVFKISSIEIALNNRVIKGKKQFLFNTHFGLGSKIPSGEENIFISSLLKEKLSVYFIPETIVKHEAFIAQKVKSDGYYKEKYNVIKVIFPILGIFIFILFFLKKKTQSFVGDLKRFCKDI